MEATIRELEILSRGVGPDAPEPALIEVARARVKAGRWLVEHASGATRHVPDRDCFVGVDGLPEVAASELTLDHLASGLQCHGGLVVREFLSGREVRCFAGTWTRPSCSATGWTRSTRRHGNRRSARPSSRGCSPSRPPRRGDPRDLRGQRFSHLVRSYLGTRPVLVAPHEAEARGERGWHPMASGRRVLLASLGALNAWSALTPVGEHCGAVEVIPRRMDEVVGFSGDTLANLEAALPLDYSTRLPQSLIPGILAETPLDAPVLEPGDAMLFDDMTLHRTGTARWTVPSRDIAITWFFDPARFPRDGTPLAV